MTKIEGWSKSHSAQVPSGFLYQWEHDDTGDKLVLTEKVPNDGYYVMGYSADEDVRLGSGRRFRYDPARRHARRMAADVMRRNPDGL